MKKLFSGLLAVLMTLASIAILSLVSVAPANASDTSTKITICHANNGTNGFTSNTVSKNSIVKKSGDEGGHGNHDEDIIPPFPYNFGGNDQGIYSGKNWVSNEIGNAFIANNCQPKGNTVAPVLANSSIIGTCLKPLGDATMIVVPVQSFGVTASAPVLANGAWTVTYTKPVNTTYNTYQWIAGFNGTQTITITPPGHGDPYWDDTKNACNLPDTGAGGISNSALMYGGIALGLGMLALAVSVATNRRKV